MKKYLRFTCSVCKRSADRLVDNTRVTPDKCTITLRCEGRLFPVAYISNGGVATTPQVGITDWRPRTTSVSTTKPEADVVLLNTSTGSFKQIVLAAKLPTDPGPTATLVLTLTKRVDAPKSYRQYIYRFENTFTSVSGVESGLEKKTLRFSVSDNVEVYLNGIKLERGTNANDYQLYDGSSTSAIPPNTISFNSQIALPGVTQVDVVISPPVALSTSTITFKRAVDDESRRGTGAWENVSHVTRLNAGSEDYYLFYCDLGDATDLQLNTLLTAATTAMVGFTAVSTNDILLLLARAPYSFVDRYTTIVVPLSTLSSERDYFKYSIVDGGSNLSITSTSTETLYPPLKVVRFQVEKPLTKALSGSDDQIVVDGASIVGPDA